MDGHWAGGLYFTWLGVLRRVRHAHSLFAGAIICRSIIVPGKLPNRLSDKFSNGFPNKFSDRLSDRHSDRLSDGFRVGLPVRLSLCRSFRFPNRSAGQFSCDLFGLNRRRLLFCR